MMTVSHFYAEASVIVNTNNTAEISNKNIKKPLTGKTSKYSDGQQETLITNTVDNGVQTVFPVKINSDKDIIEYAKANKGSVAVISTKSVTDEVRVIKNK